MSQVSRAERFAPPPIGASARKAADPLIRQAAQLRKNAQVNPGKAAEWIAKAEGLERQASQVAQAEQARQVAADKAQAEQRVRAGAVGARSEAVKQQEQRAVSPTPLGSINEPQPTIQKPTGPQVIKVKLSDSVQATSNFGGSLETRAPIPKGASYFVLGPAAGVPQIFSFSKQKDDDYKIPNVYGPPEKPQQQGPKEINDPWGIISGSNQILTGLETKAIESKKILDSGAPILGVDAKGTKAKAYIESAQAAIGKNLVSIAGFINIGAGAAARQKGEQYDKLDVDLGLGEFGKFEIPSVERVKIPDTLTAVTLQKASEGKQTVLEVLANIPSTIGQSVK